MLLQYVKHFMNFQLRVLTQPRCSQTLPCCPPVNLSGVISVTACGDLDRGARSKQVTASLGRVRVRTAVSYFHLKAFTDCAALRQQRPR